MSKRKKNTVEWTARLAGWALKLLPWLSLVVTGIATWFVVSSSVTSLFVWEAATVIYVVFVVGYSWWLDKDPVVSNGEEKPDVWAWCLPFITSAAGIKAASVALGFNAAAKISDDAWVLAVAASVGIVLSWLMLHIGFADVYRYLTVSAAKPQLEFPGSEPATHTEYLYFALTIGSTFSTSDATVLTSRARKVLTIHSVISFFYNALVVAVVFQVLQQLMAA